MSSVNTVPPETAGASSPLATPGGRVVVAAGLETAISTLVASQTGYLKRLQAICTVAGAATGFITLRDSAGGATLIIIEVPVVAAPGGLIIVDFPIPARSAVGGAFTVQHSVAGLGTWNYFVNGYRI